MNWLDFRVGQDYFACALQHNGLSDAAIQLLRFDPMVRVAGSAHKVRASGTMVGTDVQQCIKQCCALSPDLQHAVEQGALTPAFAEGAGTKKAAHPAGWGGGRTNRSALGTPHLDARRGKKQLAYTPLKLDSGVGSSSGGGSGSGSVTGGTASPPTWLPSTAAASAPTTQQLCQELSFVSYNVLPHITPLTHPDGNEGNDCNGYNSAAAPAESTTTTISAAIKGGAPTMGTVAGTAVGIGSTERGFFNNDLKKNRKMKRTMSSMAAVSTTSPPKATRLRIIKPRADTPTPAALLSTPRTQSCMPAHSRRGARNTAATTRRLQGTTPTKQHPKYAGGARRSLFSGADSSDGGSTLSSGQPNVGCFLSNLPPAPAEHGSRGASGGSSVPSVSTATRCNTHAATTMPAIKERGWRPWGITLDGDYASAEGGASSRSSSSSDETDRDPCTATATATATTATAGLV